MKYVVLVYNESGGCYVVSRHGESMSSEGDADRVVTSIENRYGTSSLRTLVLPIHDVGDFCLGLDREAG